MIDTMLPVQYANPARRGDPYKRLMAAVLGAVIDDCRGGSVYRRSSGKGVVGAREVGRAVAYVASTDRVWPFSFENLCEALGLDAAALREELIAMRVPVQLRSTRENQPRGWSVIGDGEQRWSSR